MVKLHNISLFHVNREVQRHHHEVKAAPVSTILVCLTLSLVNYGASARHDPGLSASAWICHLPENLVLSECIRHWS